jgi:hypothetical protein
MQVRRLAAYLRQRASQAALPLVHATVTRVAPVGMADRVCVDVASMLAPGEGMLVGSFSRALFLVHSECMESAYINSRPFRVNAGAVGGSLGCSPRATRLRGNPAACRRSCCQGALRADQCCLRFPLAPRRCSFLPAPVHGSASPPLSWRPFCSCRAPSDRLALSPMAGARLHPGPRRAHRLPVRT